MKRNKRNALAYREAFLAGRIGIRGKLLTYLTVLVGFIISLIWVCQIAMLYSFYQNYRSGQVREAADTILRNIDHEDLSTLADQISAENEVCLLMVDDEGQEVLSIDHVRFCLLHRLSDRELRRLIASAPEDGSEKVEMTRVAPFRNERYHREEFEGQPPETQNRTGMSMLYVRKVTFSDGRGGTLMINAQITPTSTLLSMLRRQFLYIVAVTLAATVTIGFFMSGSVSRPIIETNEAARHLKDREYQRPPHSGGYREIAELNDTLIRAADDLKRVENLQRELIANISHDLRTPLTMIQGYAETMRDIPDEMNPENMQVIIDETNRLSSLVNEVLDFSRLRTGSMQMMITDFDLTRLVRAICGRVSAMTEKDGYVIRCEAGNPVLVRGDSARIEQVVYNLLGNALTYTGKDKTVVLTEEERDGAVRVCIRDTGSGIDPSELPFIWDRYYRTRESHKRAVIGSGLGLNICRGILENHHAPYGVDSRVGEGTTFWFELPKAEEEGSEI